jgi:hypothetical protein
MKISGFDFPQNGIPNTYQSSFLIIYWNDETKTEPAVMKTAKTFSTVYFRALEEYFYDVFKSLDKSDE